MALTKAPEELLDKSLTSALTVTVDDNSNALTLISTDADASVGPGLDLYRNSSSPADNDVLGTIFFHGEDGAGNKTEYARIETGTDDVSNGAEVGTLTIFTNNADTLTNNRFESNGSEVVINETSGNFDTRIESNGNANMLFVDAGNDVVVVGSSVAENRLSQPLAVTSAGARGGVSINSFFASSSGPIVDFQVSRNSTAGSHTVVQDGDALGTFIFRGDDGDEFKDSVAIEANVDGTPGNNDMPGSLRFFTTADSAGLVERMRLDSSGNVGISAIPSGEAAAAHVIRLGDQICIAEYDDGSNPEQFNLFHNSDSSETYIEAGEASVIQQRSGEIVFKTAASGSAGAAISFSEKVRILNGGGITFNGDTAAANALDDYEIGTWTPTLPSGGTLTNVGSNYTKIGRLVHLTSYIQTITPTNNSSGLQIGGLPFSVWGSGYTYSAGSFSYIGTSSGNVNKFGLLAAPGNSYLYFHFIDGTGGSGVTNAQWISEMGSGTGIHLIFHAIYYTDS